MNPSEFLESIRSSYQFLEEYGYKLRDVDTSINRNVWYDKQTEKEGFRIGFFWTRYGDEYRVRGLLALKRFNSVEEEVQNVMGGTLSDYFTIAATPSHSQVSDGLPFTTTGNNLHFVLRNETDIRSHASFVREFHRATALPFFNAYDTLSKVARWLADNEPGLHSNFLVGWDNSMMNRKLIVLKQTDDPSFADLFERYRSFLEAKNAARESPYVDMFSVFSRLEPYLRR